MSGARIIDTYHAQEDQRGWLIRAHCHGPVMPRPEWLRPGLQGGRERKRNDLANTHVRDRRKWEGLFTSRPVFCWVFVVREERLQSMVVVERAISSLEPLLH